MGNETNILDQAVNQIEDEAVRARIAREVELLRGSRQFGLVFDRHLPESVRLPDHPVRKGAKVALWDESKSDSWRVVGFTDTSRSVAVLDGDGGEVPTNALVVIREFGEPVYPGLRSVERIVNGPQDAPWHTIINGENFHVSRRFGHAPRNGRSDLHRSAVQHRTSEMPHVARQAALRGAPFGWGDRGPGAWGSAVRSEEVVEVVRVERVLAEVVLG